MRTTADRHHSLPRPGTGDGISIGAERLDGHALRPKLRGQSARLWRDVPQQRSDDSSGGTDPVLDLALWNSTADRGAGREHRGYPSGFLPGVQPHDDRHLGVGRRDRVRRRRDLSRLGNGALILATVLAALYALALAGRWLEVWLWH